MSGETVCACAWCGLTAVAVSDGVAEFLPEGWEFLDREELCTGCQITRGLAIERAKAERSGVNKGRGIAS
jgi:hypothetical protein